MLFTKSYRVPVPFDNIVDMLLSIPEKEFINDSIDIFKGLPEYKYPVGNAYQKENGDIVLEIAVSGFNKENLKIEIESNILTINGVIEDEEPKKFLFRNLKKKPFCVSYRLSENLDMDHIDTHLENGILKMNFPLKEEAKPVKKSITIQ